jgi:hypothetical protein
MACPKLRTTQYSKPVGAVLAALACFVLSGGLSWFSAPVAASTGAVGTKRVYIDAQYRVDPVTITNVIVGDQEIQPGVSTGPREVQPGTPFQSDEDWLKKMSISLKNRTDKVIVRAEVELYFPDTGDGSSSQPVEGYNVSLGRRPEIDSYSSHGQKLPEEPNKPALLVAPGQTFVIHIADYIDAIQSRVEETLPFAQVTRVAIRRIGFFFADGMRWNDLYGFGVPDPNHPGQFTYMDRNRFFPGDPRNNWPPPTQQVEPGRRRSG